MARQIINLGTADKGNGDPIRTAFEKANANFAEIYSILAGGSGAQIIETDVKGSVFADDSTVIVDSVNGVLHGRLMGDVEGSVFADDSTKLIDGISGKIVGPIQTSVSNVSITGGSNGQVLTTNGSGVLTWAAVSLTIDSTEIALGQDAGATGPQGAGAVAVGAGAGQVNQGPGSIAIGNVAGNTNQGIGSLGIGGAAGGDNQGDNAIAIGNGAGVSNQGNFAIAIGAGAGATNQPANSIIINANSSIDLNAAVSGLFINPVRADSYTTKAVYYNTTTKELTYADPVGGGAQIVSAPAHQYGQVGDTAGMLAYDNENFYWCFQNYVDDFTACWRRAARSLTSW